MKKFYLFLFAVMLPACGAFASFVQRDTVRTTGNTPRVEKLKDSLARVAQQSLQVTKMLNDGRDKIARQIPPYQKVIPSVPKFDSLKTGLIRGVKLDKVKEKASLLIPSSAISQTKKVAAAKSAQYEQAFREKIGGLKKTPLAFDLVLEDALRYHPAPLLPVAITGAPFQNVINLRGGLNLYGLPLAVDISTDRRPQRSLQMPGNDLFKFDFDPAKFADLFGSGLQQYADIRKNLFGGLDMGEYTKRKINEEISTRQTLLKTPAVGNILSGYLDQPGKVSELLGMSEAQIRLRMTDEITRKEKNLNYTPSTALGLLQEQAGLPGAAQESIRAMRSRESVLQTLSKTGAVSKYLGDPHNIEQLRYMNEEQLAGKISRLGGAFLDRTPALVPVNGLMPFGNPNMDSVLNHIVRMEQTANQATIKEISRKIVLSARQNNSVNLDGIIRDEQKQVGDRAGQLLSEISGNVSAQAVKRIALSREERAGLYKEIDSIATTITGIKSALNQSGIDVSKMLVIQQYLDHSGGQSGFNEFASSLYTKSPTNGLQGVFTHIAALKLGAFGIQPAGGNHDKDLFLKGGHITVQTGRFPLTFGYGSVSDLNAVKDNNFQSSVFNQPRKVTYLSTEVKNAGAGKLKISMISSLNRGISNSSYAIPAIASNNVALTLSKGLKMGRLGDLDLDVSKSTTLYSNKFQPGSEVILDRKNGLNNNLSTDLFEAISFGASHRLGIEKLDLTENVYFNYSGMGYQNPAGNGYGGARMKFGGMLKKSLFNHKLLVNLRSDFNNMPISYTSDDRWKNNSFQLDTRYNINRRFTVSGKYTTNSTEKRVEGLTNPVYAFQKLQFDGNANYKIGKYYSVSHLSVGNQSISNSYAAQGAANLLMFNYTQSVVIKRNVLTANVFYNKELSAYKLIGNLLNSDVGYQFRLFSKLNLSSGVTYLDNTGIARQAGIRQSVQFMAGKHFDLSSFIDIRKNMIRPLYPDLYAACRAELSLKYRINY